MQIVIEIPKDRYKEILRGDYIPDGNFRRNMIDVVRNGTPLPKGHGRLKDIDKIINDGISKGFCEWYYEMKDAPTIIEADKESEK